MNAPGNDNNTSAAGFLNEKDAKHAPPEKALDAAPDWDPKPNAGQFSGGPSPIPPLMAKDGVDSDDTMKFRSGTNDPADMPFPHGHTATDFPSSTATDSPPRGRFQDKVEKRSILKGDPKTARDTGQPHG